MKERPLCLSKGKIMSENSIHKLTMPKWGLTMEEGTVAEWLVDVGTQVEPGTEVVVIETDKSEQPVEVLVSGVLRRKLVAEGEVAPVAALLAVIADPSVSEADIDAFIAQVTGSVPAVPADSVTPKAELQPAPSPVAEGITTKRMSKMRVAIAKTVTEGWSIPQFPVTVTIDMEKAEYLYRTLKEAGNRLSINDVIIKAVAVARQKYPMVNATLYEDSYIFNQDVNIAVAVGLEDGLLMPVIKACQSLSLLEIGLKSRELIEKVKSSSTSEEDLSGGNFSISNLGMFGVEVFAALVPPGQAAILAVGVIKDEPVVIEKQIVSARIMRVTLSADHRVIDGLNSASFLAELKRVLETPSELQS
jgi:pyruvate dehydrogenase E2 component (dihydrolipoamide acetyltransferase)